MSLLRPMSYREQKVHLISSIPHASRLWCLHGGSIEELPSIAAKDIKVGDRMSLLAWDEDGLIDDDEFVVLQKTYDRGRDLYLIVSGMRCIGSGLRVYAHDRRWFAPDERITLQPSRELPQAWFGS